MAPSGLRCAVQAAFHDLPLIALLLAVRGGVGRGDQRLMLP
jgi:hypothetical protein